ncbi:hypothetical protein [Tardiphaga sp.]|uniref:hypothetical protein n=1 Tax=Tardiphaga sp. TaxID=1926292 RepID=UPI0026138DCB|nr:hypothetical protein [Tardiphaga sp.]MDB5617058.1 hypothetical protein [Tardiphaga sp.]
MAIFLIWLVLAILVGIAANARGRNGVGWFFLSAVLSPLVGVVFLIAMPNHADHFEARMRPEDDVLYRVGKARRAGPPGDSNVTLVGVVIALLLVGLYFAGYIKLVPTP